jgi:hypothetical protein
LSATQVAADLVTAKVAPDRTPAIAVPEAEPTVEAENPAPAKKGFWRKLNVFRKRTD